MLHANSRTASRNVFKVTTRTSNGPLVVAFPPTPSSTHTIRSVDGGPYPDPHTSDHDPSNAQRTSELTSIASSKATKNSSILPEGSGSGDEKDSGSDQTTFSSPGKNFISASPSSSLYWPILRFDGHTTHGPVYVDLPPTFEGHFALRTSNKHQPRVVLKNRDVSDKGTENIDGVNLVREVADEVLEGGEVIRGTMRLVPAGSKKSQLNENDSKVVDTPLQSRDDGQSPVFNVPSGKDKTEDGTASVPVAWANVWTTKDRVELWI